MVPLNTNSSVPEQMEEINCEWTQLLLSTLIAMHVCVRVCVVICRQVKEVATLGLVTL